jgi:hypothetical protein
MDSDKIVSKARNPSNFASIHVGHKREEGKTDK